MLKTKKIPAQIGILICGCNPFAVCLKDVTASHVILRGGLSLLTHCINLSVFRRCQTHPDYRPDSLLEWKQRKRLDLEAIIAAPEKYPQYWSPVERPGIESSIPQAVEAIS